MSSQYDILFEPGRIGPMTTPKRFYQVPHCSESGYKMSKALAAMRGVKAEGGLPFKRERAIYLTLFKSF